MGTQNTRPNVEWDLPTGNAFQWHHVKIAVLMDIRRELQTLNRLLHCQNFTSIPRTLNRIDKRLVARRPTRKARKP